MERHFVIAAKSDAGNYKDINQDSFTVKVAKTSIGELTFAVLCDGMGGLSFGEVASAHVVRAFQKWFENDMKNWIDAGMDNKKLANEWEKIIDECNSQILKYGKKENTQLGTTVTILLLFQNKYYISHIGDCRVYKMSNQSIQQITTDQTYVEREVELGHMTKEQAKNDSRQNVLLQCIGVNEEVAPDFICGEFDNSWCFLLCSDGFRHHITNEEILTFCSSEMYDQEALLNKDREVIHSYMDKQISYLIELNKNRGEKDNISAILIKSF